MRLINIGIANIDPTVGAFTSNTNKVIARAEELAAEHCTIGVFSEQVISGYPAEDLVQWKGFVSAQWDELLRFAAATRTSPTVYVLGLTVEHGGNLYNAAAVVRGGTVLGIVPKEKLPTYGVFYEKRTFSSGIPGQVSRIHGTLFGDLIFTFPFGTLAVEVCEDIWSPDGPMRRRAYSGAEVIANISASPWRAGVVNTRKEMIATRAADNVATVVYVNQVGGNDSLVFDGGGFINQAGRMMHEAPRWREQISTTVVDLDRTQRLRHENTTWRGDYETFMQNEKPVTAVDCHEGVLPEYNFRYPAPASKSFFLPPDGAPANPRTEYLGDIFCAMVAGLKGYMEKTGAFQHIGVALSGGKDSALALLVAHRYAQQRFGQHLWRKRDHEVHDLIHAISMPTRFNSQATRTIARELAQELRVTFTEDPIEEEFNAHIVHLEKTWGGEENISAIARQNAQARIRGSRMWDWSNIHHGLWIQTGNMSEKAVGYTTMGGDIMGAYSLMGNLPKTVVIELLRYLNETYYHLPALAAVIDEKASAELAENQTDEGDLMPFPVLDACFALFAGEKMMPKDVYHAIRAMWTDDEFRAMRPDFTPEMLKHWVIRFVRLFCRSIFKWVQCPQAVHLGTLDLDRERALQLPVVQSAEWLALEELENL